jgi:hypothetical protein
MRFRLLLLCLPALLGACSKVGAPVRLDFIGATGLTSGNRTVGASDTLITRAYAEGNDNDLTHMRITVKYEPARKPILYPLPLTSYDPTKAPTDEALVYVDSLIDRTPPDANGNPRGGSFLFTNRFTARSTSGTELWEYTATDQNQASATRVFRLTVRKTDSAAVFHNYTVRFRPPVVPATRPLPADVRAVRDQSLTFLNMRSGVLLPRYSLINQSNSLIGNQQLVDLICVASNTTVSLTAPTNVTSLGITATNWPTRRPTQLRATGLDMVAFNNASTTAFFNTTFDNGTRFGADSLSTGTLTKGQIIAFRVNEDNQNYTGLLLVSDIVLGTAPRVTCLVKVQK